ncbi:MAG: RHS repeat-associated core domain-containing protein [Bacteroidota bacterium]
MSSIKNTLFICLSLWGTSKLFAQTTTLTITSPTPVAVYEARDLVRVTTTGKISANSTTQSILRINKNIVAPINVNGNPYVGYNINTVYNIDKNLPVGFVKGTGGVSSGVAQYNIPIPLAPGTAGMVPNVSISYNSSQTNGIVGVGWGISGISSISRANKDIYYGISVAPISLTSSDKFTLDGNMIWALNPDGSRRLENDNFTDVLQIGGYASFSVTTKEGLVMEYGNTADSKLMVANAAGTQVPLIYYINKVIDKSGNYYTYEYYNQGGEVAIKEIKYTGNASAGVPLYNSVKFYYDFRSDQSTGYFKGNVLNNSLILREVEVFCEGQSIKRIVPTYNLIDGKSYLSSITEYGLDNSHLNPTVFAYENSLYTSGGQNINVSSLPALADYKVADFNGDGKADILAYLYTTVDAASGLRSYYSWKLYINQNDGTSYNNVASYTGSGNFQAYSYYGLPNTFSPDAEGTTAINLNGDEKEDALFLTSAGGNTSYTVQISNGAGFTPGYMFNLPTGANIIFADIDGDKIPEGIAHYAPTNNLYIVNFKTQLYQVRNASTCVVDPTYGTGTSGTFKIVQVVDYDADGAQELLVEINSKWRVLKVGQYNQSANQGASNFILNVQAVDDVFNGISPTGCYSYENVYADFNGDGLTDNLTVSTTPNAQCPNPVPNNFFLRYNAGKYNAAGVTPATSFYKTPSTAMSTALPGRNEITKKVLFADMNNDGKTDIITLAKNTALNKVDIYVGYSPDFSTLIAIGSVAGTTFPDAVNYNYYTGQVYPTNGNNIAEFLLGDFDGDSYTDIMFKNTNNSSGSNLGERTIFYNHPLGTDGKLAKVTNGYNQSINFTYKTLAKGGIYTKGTGCTYPFVDMQSPVKVVSTMQTPDANGIMFNTDYTYEGAKFSQFGQGFLGYDKISETNNLLQTKTISKTPFYSFNSVYLSQVSTAYGYRVPEKTETYLLSNLSLPMSQTYRQYTYILSNGPTFPGSGFGIGHYLKLYHEVNEDLFLGNTVDNMYTYDNYHNVTVTDRQVGMGAYTSIVNTMDANLYGNKYPGFVQSTQTSITQTGQPTITRTSAYTYYSNGLLNQVTNNGSSSSCSNVTNYIYNATGQASSITESSTGNTPRTTTFDYDAARFRFVTKTTNPLSHFAQAVYDNRLGVQLKTIDITNLATIFTYDAYGRTTSVKTPDNHTTTNLIKWYDSGDDVMGDPFPVTNALITTQVNAPNSPMIKSLITASGLNVKNITEGFNQNFVSDRSTYTSLGQPNINKASYLIPCANPSQVLTTTHTYNDPLYRLKSKSTTDGTTALNTTIVYTTITGGNVTAVTTPDGKTKSTTVNVNGLVSKVQENPAGTTLTYDYFSDGQLKSSALNGVTTYNLTYDPCGNMYTQDEPNNGITVYSIDGFGQLKSKVNDSKTYTINYDVLGRTTSMAGPEGTYTYNYIASGSGLENIETETAPNGVQYKYYYDAQNRIYKTDQLVGSTYSSLVEYDIYSNPVKYTYPSGFAIKMAYDNLGYPTTVKNDATNGLIWQADELNSFGQYTKHTLGNGIQTLSGYNTFGLPLSTVASSAYNVSYNFNNATGNLTSFTDNLKGFIEAHTYDNLDRLKTTTFSDGFWIIPTLTQDYDPNGNITNKSDIGDYKYGGPKPNAVLKVKNDAALISTTQQDITYSAFEKALNIIEGDEQAVITYGPDQERVKTDFANTVLGTSSARYYLGDYEKEVKTGMIREVHYINTPSGLSGMYVIENGVGTMYYTYSDHLGTIQKVTNGGGGFVAEQSFDPWGQRRNASAWADYSTIAAVPAWLFRGYTGHEHLPQFSLINMNGRMYDPQNARMLSADPVLHDATSSQAYNKYSYCINNPLKYTDPSGYDFSFSTKGADITIGSPFGSGGLMALNQGGMANGNDVDLSMNLNGKGWSSVPGHQSAPTGGFTEASGNWVSNESLIYDAHQLWSKNHGNDVAYIPGYKDGSGAANEGNTSGLEAYAFGSKSDQMYKYLKDKSLFDKIDEILGKGLFGSSANYDAIKRNSGNNNPYMFSNQELHDAAMVELEIVSMFVPVGEVFQGVKWAGKGINFLLKGGKTFNEFKAGYWATRAKVAYEPIVNTVNGKVFKVYNELHHRFIPQRWQKAYGLPNWLVNNKLNLQPLSSIEHAIRDPYRWQFLPKWVKEGISSGIIKP